MQITPPFGFSAITPLRPDLPVLPWRDATLPAVFGGINAMPISVSEAAFAARDFPLVFGDATALLAVLGLQEGENLFMANGRWDASVFAPALVRRYPFCASTVRIDGVEQKAPLLCVDDAYIGPAGTPVLEPSRLPTSAFRERGELVLAFEMDLRDTAKTVSHLDNLGLLKPFTLQATLNQGGAFHLRGMRRVEEDALRQLPAKILRGLIESGAMRLIYTHIQSLHNFERLLNRKIAQGRTS
jgi:hypothetical protein